MGTVGAIFGLGYAVYLLTSLVYVAISVRHGKWLLIGTVLISLACFVASIVTINELGSSLKEHPIVSALAVAAGWFGLLAPGVVIAFVWFRRTTA